MKEIKWINGNKMLIETGHKTFDQQTNIISTGNIIANTLIGKNIRSWWDDGKGLIDYETNKREPGHLFNWDIEHFKVRMPDWIRRRIEKYSQEDQYRNGMWLYELFHFRGHDRIIHGWILTDIKHNWIITFNNGRSFKTDQVLAECKLYLSN